MYNTDLLEYRATRVCWHWLKSAGLHWHARIIKTSNVAWIMLWSVWMNLNINYISRNRSNRTAHAICRFHRQGFSGIQDYPSGQGGLYDRRNRTDSGINRLFRSDRIHGIRRSEDPFRIAFRKMSKTRTITVEKQALAPAKEVAKTTPGLEMQVTDGMFLNSSKLGDVKEWKKSVIKDLREITSVVKSSESMRGVKQYAAIATGYVNIPEDGVYYISSDNEEVWIDGKLLVNNAGEVKRFSRHDSSAALSKGLHEIKVVFLGHIIGGWPSNWNDGSVKLRKADSDKFVKITPEMLVH